MRKLVISFAFSFMMAASAADFDFGPVGMTPGDTARVSAFCLAEQVRSASCEIEIHFHDTRGRILKQEAMTLLPDNGGSLDLRLPEAANVRRGEIIPCVRVISGAIAANVQVFDTLTNRTRVFRNWGDRAAAMAGEIHFGSVGMIGADAARIGALCPAQPLSETSTPCEITFIFHDTRGRILKQATDILDPGASGFLGFRTAEAGLPPARRGEIIPCIRVARGAVVSSLEVFDVQSGASSVSTHAAATLLP